MTRRRQLVFGLIILTLFVFIFSHQTNRDRVVTKLRDVLPKSELSLLFVGDIMLSRNIGMLIERNGPMFPFELIASTTKNADITFGNLENPVSVRGKNQGSIYSFRASPVALQGLVYAGFDIVSLANNHIADWGDDALRDSVGHLLEYGLQSVGVGNSMDEARRPNIIRKNGHTVCFQAYSEFAGWYGKEGSSPVILPIDDDLIVEDIKNNKDMGCSMVVVSLHWGEEYNTKANNTQKEKARAYVDAGANFVIGHHPHVVQEIEEYNGGLIAYSLGNFVFDQNFSVDTRRSVILDSKVSAEGNISYSIIPIRFTNTYQPYVFTVNND